MRLYYRRKIHHKEEVSVHFFLSVDFSNRYIALSKHSLLLLLLFDMNLVLCLILGF